MISSLKIARYFTLVRKSKLMPTRVLGKTGLRCTIFGLGGQSLLETPNRQKEAYDLINKALDLGVTYFDTATIYGPSREYLGKSLGYRRQNITLASKLRCRTYNEARKELDQAYDLLKTDYIDIIYFHTIEDEGDMTIFTRNGALRTVLEDQNRGKIRFIGFSGHHDPVIMNRFIDEFDFDTVLLPTNPAVPEFDSTIKKARARNIGIVGMKVMSRGILPLGIDPAKLLQYSISKADVSIVGCTTESDVEENVSAAVDYYEGMEFKFNLNPELKEKSRYFLKGYSGKWPSTYQPDWPGIQYD